MLTPANLKSPKGTNCLTIRLCGELEQKQGGVHGG